MKFVAKVFVSGAAIFALLQFVRPGIPSKPVSAELQVSPEVQRILHRDCYSCHSDERRLSWFDQIVPAYWLVRHDILTARRHLDFSTLASRPAAVQRATLFEAVNMIQLGVMPPPQFAALHAEAHITPDDLATLKDWLAPWKPALIPPQPSAFHPNAGPAPAFASLAAVLSEPNGLSFRESIVGWKLISTTDRGDNNTFRFILGNDVAFQAVASGRISPWPDGARLAKVAWQQQPAADGLIHPGKFVQVELMVKNAHLYKDTDGWGWGRWRGAELKPYGSNAHFVTECTGCHLPLRGNDYVYTQPITAVTLISNEVVNNRAAQLPPGLPYQPFAWNPITMYVDPARRTTATLYGNAAAMQAARIRGAASVTAEPAPAYSQGAVLALVTWAQRDDPHWFGARIPDQPLSVEFVQVAASGRPDLYTTFAGPQLAPLHPASAIATQRTTFILGLAPAPLP